MKFLSLISLLAGALLVSAGSYGRHSEKCIPKETLEAIVPKYIAAFSGITDGGKQARRVFRQDFKQYSQSTWWVTPGQGDVIAAHAAADDYPPIINNRSELIRSNIRDKYDPNTIIKGPVAYGCNTFTFYWKVNSEVPGPKPFGRINGIDLVFLDYKSGKISEAWTEFNTLNLLYNLGAHVTWSTNPTCCECATPFDPSCKCPAPTCKKV